MIRPRSCIRQFDNGVDDRINAHRELLLEKAGQRNRRQAFNLGSMFALNDAMRLLDLSDDEIGHIATED